MASEEIKATPIVMMSGNDDNEFISASMQKGAKDYIVKPLRPAVPPQLLLSCRL
jgi:PleD family two-component response regulator